jgi:hypothetical protein
MNTESRFTKSRGASGIRGVSALSAIAAALLADAPGARAQSLAAWTGHKNIVLNTGASGANVTGDVKDFPVAVQLNAANFDFTQAGPMGEDLRFTDAAGAALPYEIESWDAAGKKAAVWVKTDVKGNDAAQYIVMYWGNPAAASASDSKAVFSAADGWVGGWHLGEAGNTTEGGYKDATASGADMTGTGFAAANTADCRVGKCPEFNAAGKRYLKLNGAEKNKLFDLTQKLTFSIWSKANKYVGDYVTMFSKGDDSWRVQMYGNSGWNGGKYVSEMCVEGPGDGNVDICMGHESIDLKPGAWYHLTVVHDHPNVKYYVNGVAQSGNPGGTWVSMPNTTVGIGYQSKNGPTRWFDGYLDEARFLGVPKDANWVKLDFESQKEGSKLLEFGAPATGLVRGRPSSSNRGLSGARTQKAQRYDLHGRALEGAMGPGVYLERRIDGNGAAVLGKRVLMP